MSQYTFQEIIKQKLTVHLVGIGGISMRSLALTLKDKGLTVTGSDRDSSPATDMLIKNGITVSIGHDLKNIDGCNFVIRTSAVPDNNCEIAEALSRGITVIERAEAWGMLMGEYRNAICVAGTHGKTTTTSMISTVALKSGQDPTIMVGGELASIGGGMRIGGKNLFIAEACEYKNSFHSFCPTVAMILNVDYDHPDFFKDLDEVITSFKHFAMQVPKETGTVIVNYDDPKAMSAVSDCDRRIITFGINENADVYAGYVKQSKGFYSFSIYNKGALYADIRLIVPGKHNVENTLACACACICMGISGDDFKKGIESYTGVGRRFEYKTTINGARVFDEYAHMPQEVASSLASADLMGDGRTICVFQPHTYSRTEALFEDFVKALRIADIVVLAEIFPAREENVHSISSKLFLPHLPAAYFFETFNEIATFIKDNAKNDDIVITMGAGDVYKVSDMLIK